MSQSDLISITSAAIAFASLVFTVVSSRKNEHKIEKITEAYFKLFHSTALSIASRKNVMVVSKIWEEYEILMKRLGDGATKSFQKIYDSIDSFDENESGTPALRHAYHENIEIVAKAYDYDFTYQPGLYIINQLRFLKYFERKYYIERPRKAENALFRFFKRKQNHRTANDEIMKSEIFNGNLSEIYNRISSKYEPEFFMEMMNHAKDYISVYYDVRPSLERLLEQLKALERKNTIEQFKIDQTPYLGDNFFLMKENMERAIELSLVDFHGFEEFKNHNGISHVLYIGCVLHLAKQHYLWGRYNQRNLNAF